MKKSKKIALTLLASVCFVASGCGSEQNTRRNIYANRKDCAKDWGEDECENYSGSHNYYGPHYYYSNGRPWYFPKMSDKSAEVSASMGASHFTPSKVMNSFASTKTIRGGFGGSSLFHGGSSLFHGGSSLFHGGGS